MAINTDDTSERFGAMSIDTLDNTTSFTLTGLTPATNYTLFLSAFTGAGEGDNSTSVTDSTTFIGKLLQQTNFEFCIHQYYSYRNVTLIVLY